MGESRERGRSSLVGHSHQVPPKVPSPDTITLGSQAFADAFWGDVTIQSTAPWQLEFQKPELHKASTCTRHTHMHIHTYLHNQCIRTGSYVFIIVSFQIVSFCFSLFPAPFAQMLFVFSFSLTLLLSFSHAYRRTRKAFWENLGEFVFSVKYWMNSSLVSLSQRLLEGIARYWGGGPSGSDTVSLLSVAFVGFSCVSEQIHAYTLSTSVQFGTAWTCYV